MALEGVFEMEAEVEVEAELEVVGVVGIDEDDEESTAELDDWTEKGVLDCTEALDG
jgi:hypothetical protein